MNQAAETEAPGDVVPPPRSASQRRADTLQRLERDVDLWVATAGDEAGSPHLVPLSFLWDGTSLLIAIESASVTSRNLQASGRVRLGLGPTRDLVLIEGRVETTTPAAAISDAIGDAFATKAGFDPRRLSRPFLYFGIRPRSIQAWREANELDGRVLMRDGRWIGSP